MAIIRKTILCTFALLLSPLFVQAAAVAPSVIELSSQRGEVIDSSFRILNTGASEQVYYLDTLSFDADGEDGSPLFTPENNSVTPFLTWFDFPLLEITVPAQAKVDVPFSVVVPDDVPSGSYHGAITVSTAPSDVVATNGATIEARIAILVFLVIEGETVEKLELLDFTLDQTQATLPFGIFKYRIQNQGNVHLAPEGEIVLKNLFGQVIATIEANENKARILPGSTRTYTVDFGADLNLLNTVGFQLRHLVIGPVTAELNVTYSENESLTSQAQLMVIPIELLIVLATALLFAGVLYRKLPRH